MGDLDHDVHTKIDEMAEIKKTLSNNYIFVSVGLLLGFLLGFVVLLANLPDYRTQSQVKAYDTEEMSSRSSFQFYNILPGRHEDNFEGKLPEYKSDASSFTNNASFSLVNKYRQVDSAEYKKVKEIPASYASDTYYLQAGSFRTESDAEKMRAKLLLNGLDAFVKPSNVKGKIHHRVRLGPYYDRQDLGEAREMLQKRGISYMVLRVKS